MIPRFPIHIVQIFFSLAQSIQRHSYMHALIYTTSHFRDSSNRLGYHPLLIGHRSTDRCVQLSFTPLRRVCRTSDKRKQNNATIPMLAKPKVKKWTSMKNEK